MIRPWQHLYNTRRWKAERLDFLAHHPLCMWPGCNDLATVVDHWIPHKGDEALFWDKKGFRALCKPCHDGAKQQLERTGVVRGCDEQGNPLSPSAHWV